MTEPTSLHFFCKDRNLAKTTVKRWLNEQGYSTSEELSPEAVEAALAQFCSAARSGLQNAVFKILNLCCSILTSHFAWKSGSARASAAVAKSACNRWISRAL